MYLSCGRSLKNNRLKCDATDAGTSWIPFKYPQLQVSIFLEELLWSQSLNLYINKWTGHFLSYCSINTILSFVEALYIDLSDNSWLACCSLQLQESHCARLSELLFLQYNKHHCSRQFYCDCDLKHVVTQCFLQLQSCLSWTGGIFSVLYIR